MQKMCDNFPKKHPKIDSHIAKPFENADGNIQNDLNEN